MNAVIYRIYQNIFMKSRLGEYSRLLENLVKQGYRCLTVAEFAALDLRKDVPARTCVIRMDVDSDIPTAGKMFDISREFGLRGTYYFRLSTLDCDLIRRISGHGSEVGYHYEELATIAKRRGLRNRGEIDESLPLIREEFAKNIAKFAECAGKWPLTIASHGDWINRRLGIPNSYEIDPALRARFNIVAEAYDEWLNAPVDARFADTDAPRWWKPLPPERAIADGVSCLYFLVHPRQWRAKALENIGLDITRMAEGAAYAIRCSRATSQRKPFVAVPPLGG